jgi:hypothetical protein
MLCPFACGHFYRQKWGQAFLEVKNNIFLLSIPHFFNTVLYSHQLISWEGDCLNGDIQRAIKQGLHHTTAVASRL